MAELTDTKAFDAYQEKAIVDVNIDDYLLQTIEDPYGIYLSVSSDITME